MTFKFCSVVYTCNAKYSVKFYCIYMFTAWMNIYTSENKLERTR